MIKRFALSAVLALSIAATADALPITFSGASGSLAASASFDVSGSDLLVTLTNTGGADPAGPGDILTGLIFALQGNPLLTKTSATLTPGSSVIHGPTPSTDSGNVVGGEWAYTNSLTGAYSGRSAIYSSGYFNGNAHFPGSNLQGPVSVNGVQYGITTLNDQAGNDNGGIMHEGLIRNSMTFVLGSLPERFDLGSIDDVVFQYGSTLDQIYFPGGDDNGAPIPEPATALLFSVGSLGLAFYRKRLKG